VSTPIGADNINADYGLPEIEIAWLAGLIEGEGCFRVGHHKNWDTPMFKMKMTDEDVMLRAAGVCGVKLYGPHVYGKYKPLWAIDTGKMDDVQRIGEMVLPYMGMRRTSKINEVLACIDDKRRAK